VKVVDLKVGRSRVKADFSGHLRPAVRSTGLTSLSDSLTLFAPMSYHSLVQSGFSRPSF